MFMSLCLFVFFVFMCVVCVHYTKYCRDLASRLLARRLLRSYSQLDADNGSEGSRVSLSLDLEKSFLSLIKLQCGNSSVLKTEGMLNDLYVSDTTNIEFAQREDLQLDCNLDGEMMELQQEEQQEQEEKEQLDFKFDGESFMMMEQQQEEQQQQQEEKKEEQEEQEDDSQEDEQNLLDRFFLWSRCDGDGDGPAATAAPASATTTATNALVRQEQQQHLPAFHVLLLTQNFWPNLSTWPTNTTVILPEPMGRYCTALKWTLGRYLTSPFVCYLYFPLFFSSYWLFFSPCSLLYIHIITATCQRLFVDWFREKRSRRLQWSYSHGEVCLRMHLPATAATATAATAGSGGLFAGTGTAGGAGGSPFYDLLLVPEQVHIRILHVGLSESTCWPPLCYVMWCNDV
jgi:hypothetical protein